MMALITGANKKGVRFTPDEIQLIMEIMKEGKSDSEKAQIDKTARMVTAMMQKYSK
jgi:hypothetical protein